MIVDSVILDVDYVSSNMRKEDRMELSAGYSASPLASLLAGFRLSKPNAYSIVEVFAAISESKDIDYVAENMRQADLDEIKAVGVEDPRQALLESYRNSNPECYSVMHRTVPVAMFGVVPDAEDPRHGSIWMLGTDHVTDDFPVAFLRQCRRFLPILMSDYEMVSNKVDKRNTVHIKWLKWMGFTIIREVIYGPENRPFYEFARINEHV